MRNYGIQANYEAHFPGMNGKMSEFHAIIGLYNLRRLEQLMETRQEKARLYKDKVESATNFRITSWPEDVVHTFKDFTVVLTHDKGESARNDVIRYLGEAGVETRAYFFPPVHEQKRFREYADRSLPRTECLARRVITLPFYTTMTEDEMDYVVDALAHAEERIS
jgi:dTDP-4-amino-4,6-dideoxygalactose transaminase